MLGFHIDPYEIELILKDGRKMEVELNASKIEFKAKPADMVIFRDLTERKKLVRSLEREQERFQSVAESSGDWIWEVDNQGRYTYSNPGIEMILGFTAEEIIGRECCGLLCEDEKDDKQLLFKTLANANERFCFIKHCKHKNGKNRILETHGVPIYENKKFVGFRGVDRDITERQLATEELTKGRKYLEAVLNSILSGVVIIDSKTHQIIDANNAALNMMQTTREEAIGKICHKFICPAEIGKCPITDLGLKVDKSERVLLTKSQTRMPILKSVTELVEGERCLLIENFTDLTERKEMEEKLIKTEKLAAIGELATMVAHDLRNPLQGITIGIDFIKSLTQQNCDSKIKSVLERINDSVQYSEKIIKDLLDFSATIQPERVETEPSKLIKQSLSELVIPAHIKLIDRTEETPVFFADPEKMKRVILNLVNNAFEAMPLGGTLIISSQKYTAGVEISFRDTGIGIPERKMEKLWTPFVTTKAKGMGLGLPICKRIIEAHKGEIIVETEKGKGTCFTIRLPIGAFDKRSCDFFINDSQQGSIELKPQKVN